MLDNKKELQRLAEHIYRNIKPMEKEVQLTLVDEEPTEKKYTQNWPLYEMASQREKLMFYRILKCVVDALEIKNKYKGNGRPGVYYGDIVKVLCIKAYHNYSSWRVESELKIAKAMGIIEHVPKRSTINKFMQDSIVSNILHNIYKTIAQPLRQVESSFSIDATGVQKKYGNARWQTVRHTPEENKKVRDYVKLHIISGNLTNVITDALITKGSKHESPFFPEMLKNTAKDFDVKEICADAGYLGKKNVMAAKKLGAAPWIKPKKSMGYTGRGRLTAWTGMLWIWSNYRSFFVERYHKRSNVESTFSALKRKFGDFCRTKKENSQNNEILAKIVCFNACILAENLLLYDLEQDGFIASL